MHGNRRVFLLSPASTSGRRAQQLLNPAATFALAEQVRTPAGAGIGDVFAFLSGLYFRGKLAYARAFAPSADAIRVITSDRGLVRADQMVTAADLRAMSAVPIDHAEPAYRRPMDESVALLASTLPSDADVVLLGSIATDKYVKVLVDVFGERLRFPSEFVGRGDMSRGGLLLRCVAEGRELEYTAVSGAVRRGARPPRLSR